jgi:hypothetical protein
LLWARKLPMHRTANRTAAAVLDILISGLS